MKILQTIPVLMMTVFLFSCGKEQSVEKKEQSPPDSTDIPGAGTLLIRQVGRLDGAADSTVAIFTYDAQKRITKIKNSQEGLGSQIYANEEFRFYRNSNGVIERFVDYVTYYNNGQDPDSAVYIMHLNNQSKFVYAIRTYYSSNSEESRDSLIYSYNDKGLISLFQAFSLGDDDNYFEAHRTQYTYDAKGDIIIMSVLFRDDANSTDPPQVFNFEYDDKISPMSFGNEALITGFYMHDLTCPSNHTKVKEIGGENQSLTYTYTYNSNNKPVISVVNDLHDNTTGTIKFYYQ